MSELAIIFALSSVLWYLVEKGKIEIWGKTSFSKWITIAAAAIGSFGLVFSFNLDLLFATNITEQFSIAGQIVTGLILMSGSSAVSEIIEAVSNISKTSK